MKSLQNEIDILKAHLTQNEAELDLKEHESTLLKDRIAALELQLADLFKKL